MESHPARLRIGHSLTKQQLLQVTGNPRYISRGYCSPFREMAFLLTSPSQRRKLELAVCRLWRGQFQMQQGLAEMVATQPEAVCSESPAQPLSAGGKEATIYHF
jgi:hypothetical protein